MAFNLDFDICLTDDCESLRICDTTCSHNPCVPYDCCDGYGYLNNPTRHDVHSTSFYMELPDGQCIPYRDFGFVPAKNAYKQVVIDVFSTGGFLVVVDSVVIATVLYQGSISATITDIVSQINAGHTSPDYYAEKDSVDSFTIYASTPGSSMNGKVVSLLPDSTSDLSYYFSSNGNGLINGGGNDCFVLTSSLIYSFCQASEDYSSTLPDGVYMINYVIKDELGKELGRAKKRFLIDCNVKHCLKQLILASLKGCKCDQSEAQDRIMRVRNEIDAAHWEFENGNYDCANATIRSAGKLCKHACLDC